mmetsp:Transcript_106809/g.308958  ORF Transcript_106809/g.308958 Transcript_106809/m.308958 type:complete len:238 (+) Transcript_106809:1059-1772(+)
MLSVFWRKSRSSDAVCSHLRCVASNSCRMSSNRLLAMRFASTARNNSCFKASTSVLSSFGGSAASLLPASGSGSAVGATVALSFSSADLATVSRETRTISVRRCTLLSNSASLPAKSSLSSDFSRRVCESCRLSSSIVARYSSSLALLLSLFAELGADGGAWLRTTWPSSSIVSPSKSCKLPISAASAPLRAPLAAALPSTLTLSSSSILVNLLPVFHAGIFRMLAPRLPPGFPPPP